MTTSFVSRQVKTRKFHMCNWCNEVIVRGRMAQVIEYKDDNDEFQRDRMHPNCFIALKDSGLEEYEPGIQQRGGYDPDI